MSWSTEAMAMHWSGIHHPEVWAALPSYERNTIITLYEQEQADLEYRRAGWVEGAAPKPHRIRDYQTVRPAFNQPAHDEFQARAKAMADQLSADWSVGREATVCTYDPFLADAVSHLLGRTIESVLPPVGQRDAIPLSWLLYYGVKQEMKKQSVLTSVPEPTPSPHPKPRLQMPAPARSAWSQL